MPKFPNTLALESSLNAALAVPMINEKRDVPSNISNIVPELYFRKLHN